MPRLCVKKCGCKQGRPFTLSTAVSLVLQVFVVELVLPFAEPKFVFASLCTCPGCDAVFEICMARTCVVIWIGVH